VPGTQISTKQAFASLASTPTTVPTILRSIIAISVQDFFCGRIRIAWNSESD